MPVPLRYNLRSLFYRKTATTLTVIAVALTVAILVTLLSLQQGFQRSVAGTGSDRNVIALRKGSASENQSIISREDLTRIKGINGLAQTADGQPLVSGEIFAGVNVEREVGGATNVSVRGVEAASFAIRGPRVVDGKAFRPGTRELVVGRSLVGRVQNCRIGGSLRIGKETWPIVGVMDADGAAFDSEIWGDVELLLQAFNYPAYTTVVMKVADGEPLGEIASFKDGTQEDAGSGVLGRLTTRLRGMDFESERAYFTRQAGFVGGVIMALAIFLTALMSFGALAGCTNTLLAAVQGRTPEIGALLAIGYRPWHIFLGFVAESLLLAFVGGALGLLATLPLAGLETGTTNWATFTEQAFAFEINGTVVTAAFALILAVGFLGGVLPAWRAARLKPVDALRHG